MKVARIPLDDPAEKNGLIRYSLRPRGIGHRPEDAPIALSIPASTGRFPYIHANRAAVLRGNKDYVYERITECGVAGIVSPAQVKDHYLVPKDIRTRFDEQLRTVDALDSVVVDPSTSRADGVFNVDQQRQAVQAQQSNEPMGLMRQVVETRRKNRSQGRVAMSNRKSIRPSLDDSFDAILGRQGNVLETKDRSSFTLRTAMPSNASDAMLARPQTFSRPKQGLQSTMIRSHDPKQAPRGYGVDQSTQYTSRPDSLHFHGTGNYGPSIGQVRNPNAVSRRKNIQPVPTSVV